CSWALARFSYTPETLMYLLRCDAHHAAVPIVQVGEVDAGTVYRNRPGTALSQSQRRGLAARHRHLHQGAVAVGTAVDCDPRCCPVHARGVHGDADGAVLR